jgi:organic radical activating enzyme
VWETVGTDGEEIQPTTQPHHKSICSNLKQEKARHSCTTEGSIMERCTTIYVLLINLLSIHGIKKESNNFNRINLRAVTIRTILDKCVVKRIP